MLALLHLALRHAWWNSHWMGWNLLLAIVPLGLAIALLVPDAPRTRVWWTGVAVFVVFLPNAPYVITDVVHLFSDVRSIESRSILTMVVIPQYVLFWLIGFEAYVGSLLLLGAYMRREGLGQRVATVETSIHLMCAIGIFIGRFGRWNTWDLLARPTAVFRSLADAGGLHMWVFIVMTFAAISVGYAVLRQLTLAAGTRVRAAFLTGRPLRAGAIG